MCVSVSVSLTQTHLHGFNMLTFSKIEDSSLVNLYGRRLNRTGQDQPPPPPPCDWHTLIPALRIHLSRDAHAALAVVGGYNLQERGQMEIKVMLKALPNTMLETNYLMELVECLWKV